MSAEVTLGFGKYRDTPLAKVPADYLEWLQGEGIKSPRLAEAVEEELRRRPAAPKPATQPDSEATRKADLDLARGALDYVQRAERALRQYLAAHEAKR